MLGRSIAGILPWRTATHLHDDVKLLFRLVEDLVDEHDDVGVFEGFKDGPV